MSTDRSQAAATATQRLDSIAFWSRCTFIATLVGVVVLLGGVAFATVEYIRFRSAVTSAMRELDKGAAELKRSLER